MVADGRAGERASGGSGWSSAAGSPARSMFRLFARSPVRPPARLAPPIEPRRRHVRRALRAERHDQQRDARAERLGAERERIRRELPHLVLVELDHVEAAEPGRRVRERLQHPHAVVLHAEEQAVQVGVDRAAESLAERLRRAQRELEARDEVQVERVEVADHRPELEPGPRRARRPTSARSAAPPTGSAAPPGCSAPGLRCTRPPGVSRDRPRSSSAASRRQVTADLDERNDLPVWRQARVQPAERVGDAAPLLGRRRQRIPTVDEVPDERSDDADLRHPRPSGPGTPSPPRTRPPCRRARRARSGMRPPPA